MTRIMTKDWKKGTSTCKLEPKKGFAFSDRASVEGGGLHVVEEVAQEAEQEVTADASE